MDGAHMRNPKHEPKNEKSCVSWLDMPAPNALTKADSQHPVADTALHRMQHGPTAQQKRACSKGREAVSFYFPTASSPHQPGRNVGTGWAED